MNIINMMCFLRGSSSASDRESLDSCSNLFVFVFMHDKIFYFPINLIIFNLLNNLYFYFCSINYFNLYYINNIFSNFNILKNHNNCPDPLFLFLDYF